MRTYLKIKIKSLAAEAKMIRQEEHKWKKRNRNIFWGLRIHRIKDVRDESRAANLAYGFLKGKTYRQIERKSYEVPNWNRVRTLVEKYGIGDKKKLIEDFTKWRTEDFARCEQTV